MKRSSVFVCLAASVLILSACAPPPAPEPEPMPEPEPTIEGAWTLEEITTVGGPNEGTVTDPQPSLWVFAGAHYSEMYVIPESEARALFEQAPQSDAEIRGAYDTFIANSGSYELQGSTLVMRPMVAKHPNFMQGGSQSYDYRLEGDTLWLTDVPGMITIPGVELEQLYTEATRKLIRLE